MQTKTATSDDTERSVTPPLLLWTSALDTGLPDIDREHRGLADVINALGRARALGADAAELGVQCQRLQQYAVDHFRHEEALMAAWPLDAAEVAMHVEAHRAFADRIGRAAELVDTDAPAVVDHLLSFLVNWLVHHISGVDARMARRIHALQGREAAAPASAAALHEALVDTVSRLYDSLGERTLELVAANAALKQEVARRHASETALRHSEARFSQLYQYAPVALWEIDWSGARAALAAATAAADAPLPAWLRAHPEALQPMLAALRVCDVNDAALRQAAAPRREQLLGQRALALFESSLPVLVAALAELAGGADASSGEIAMRRTDGARRDLAFNVVAMPGAGDGRDVAIVATLDVTESKQVMQHLSAMSRHDALTGLANRLLLSEQTAQALAAARRDRHRVAVIFLDLDGFKPVNDEHGHAVGDALLVEVAARLRGSVRATDTVARLGGDEFVVLLAGVVASAQALALAEKLRTELARPYLLAGRELRVSASVGLAIYPEHGDDGERLFEHADAAMYAAKQSGNRAVHVHAPALESGPGAA